MTNEELERLRAKYGAASAGDVQDPNFRKVIDLLFKGKDRRAKPYEGISTFLDAPMRLEAPGRGRFLGHRYSAHRRADGSRRDASARLPAGAEGGAAGRADWPLSPCAQDRAACEAGVFDIGDVPFRSRYSLEQSHEDIEAFYRPIVEAGADPFQWWGSFDDPAHPQGDRRQAARGHAAYRCALRHQRALTRARVSTMAVHSARRCWLACSIPSG